MFPIKYAVSALHLRACVGTHTCISCPLFFSLQINDFIVESIQLFAFIKVRISQDLKGLLFQYCFFFTWPQTDIKGRNTFCERCAETTAQNQSIHKQHCCVSVVG